MPIIRPLVMSMHSTPKKVTSMAKPSAFEYFHASTKGLMLTSFHIETIIVAARIESGSKANSSVKYKLTITMRIEEITPAIGVLAPASALTTVRDRLPDTGKAELIPAPKLARPSAQVLDYCSAHYAFGKQSLVQLKLILRN